MGDFIRSDMADYFEGLSLDHFESDLFDDYLEGTIHSIVRNVEFEIKFRSTVRSWHRDSFNKRNSKIGDDFAICFW